MTDHKDPPALGFTDDHEVLTASGEWVSVKDIRPGVRVLGTADNCKPVFFPVVLVTAAQVSHTIQTQSKWHSLNIGPDQPLVVFNRRTRKPQLANWAGRNFRNENFGICTSLKSAASLVAPRHKELLLDFLALAWAVYGHGDPVTSTVILPFSLEVRAPCLFRMLSVMVRQVEDNGRRTVITLSRLFPTSLRCLNRSDLGAANYYRAWLTLLALPSHRMLVFPHDAELDVLQAAAVVSGVTLRDDYRRVIVNTQSPVRNSVKTTKQQILPHSATVYSVKTAAPYLVIRRNNKVCVA